VGGEWGEIVGGEIVEEPGWTEHER